MKEFLEQEKITLSEQESHTLDYLQVFLRNNKDNLERSIIDNATQVYNLMERLLSVLSAERLFPCLDILRLLVITPSANQHYSTEKSELTPSSPTYCLHLIFFFFFNFLTYTIHTS